MTVTTATGTFTIASTDTVNTTKAITCGFQPVAIVFWLCGNTGTTDTITNATARYGFGFATSTSDRRCVGSISVHASTNVDGGRILRADACMAMSLSTNAVDGLLDISSFDANGFTTIVDDQFSVTLRVSYFAIGGSDITSASTGTFTCPTATGNFDITSLSFQPDFVLLCSNGLTSDAPTTSANRGFLTVGSAISSSARAVLAIGEGPENSTTSQSKSYAYDGEVWANLQDTPTTIGSRADFVSFLSNGFRLNFLEAGSGLTYRVPFLAIKGGSWTVGTLTTQTDTTTAITKSSFGFQPAGAMFYSHMLAKSTQDTVQAEGRVSIGAMTDASTRVVQAMLQEDGLTDTDVTSAIEHDEVYINIATNSTVQGLMDIQSVDHDGFTAIMDDADPSGAFVWFFAVGSPFSMSFSGALTTAGAINKQPNKVLIGASTPSGAMVKTVNKLLAGTLTSAGSLIKQALKIFSGSATPAGALAKYATRFVTLAGTITPVGALSKTVNKLFSGSLMPSGGLLKITNKLFSGSVTISGNVIKQANKVLLGVISFIGVLVATGSATLDEATRQAFASIINLDLPWRMLSFPSDDPGVQQRRVLAYLYAPVATLMTLILTGVVSFAGAFNKQPNKLFVGLLAPSGGLLKTANKLLSGALTTGGALLKQAEKLFSATFTSSGTLSKQANKAFDGMLSPLGAIASFRTFFVSMAGTLTASGALVKQSNKVLTSSANFSGNLLKNSSKLFVGSVALSGALLKQTQKIWWGAFGGSGTVVKQPSKVLDGSLASVGDILKSPSKLFSRALAFDGSLLKTSNKLFASSVAFSGLLEAFNQTRKRVVDWCVSFFKRRTWTLKATSVYAWTASATTVNDWTVAETVSTWKATSAVLFNWTTNAITRDCN